MMEQGFTFNASRYDFWPIYHTIREYYSIGIEKGNYKFYGLYPSIQKLNSLIHENIWNSENFQTRWVQVIAPISEKLKKPVIGTTYGQAPSFSSYLELETKNFDTLTETKKIHFIVSLMGPYYTVIGQDEIQTHLPMDRHLYKSNYLVVSPVDEFADLFESLCEEIEIRFPNYRFVPFFIYSQHIKGLEVHYIDKPTDQIFPSLFFDHLDLNTSLRGSEDYKAETWYVENPDLESGWTSNPPITGK